MLREALASAPRKWWRASWPDRNSTIAIIAIGPLRQCKRSGSRGIAAADRTRNQQLQPVSARAAADEDIGAELKALEHPLRERGLTSLAIFGSTARGTSRPDSDVDVLIDIAPDVRFSLIDLVSVKDFLEDKLGRKVDVVTREGLDSAIRDRVIREARAVF